MASSRPDLLWYPEIRPNTAHDSGNKNKNHFYIAKLENLFID
jgi:hypothetical protein